MILYSIQNQSTTIQQVSSAYFTISLVSSFSLSVDNADIQNFNPSQTLAIKAIILDNDNQITDINSFQFSWICILDDGQTECLDRNQKKLNYKQSSILQIDPSLLSFNSKYNFYVMSNRMNQPNTQQIAQASVSTVQIKLVIVTDMTLLVLVNYQDIIQIQLQYVIPYSLDTSQNIYIVILQHKSSQVTKKYQSISNQLSFVIQDLFPALDLTADNQFNLSFSVQDNNIGLSLYSSVYTTQLRQVPSGCQLSLSSQSSFTWSDLSVSNCNLQGQTTQYQFFYYSSLQKQTEEIESSGIIRNRKMLSPFTYDTQVKVNLPPGNNIVMVVTIGPNNLRANFTLTASFQNNNFSQIQYEQYLENQFQQAQALDQTRQIFYYQSISEAIQYYESKNLTYTPSDSIYQLKNKILQSLSDASWQNQDQQIYLLSTQINVLIKNTKIKIDIGTSQQYINDNIQSFSNIIQSISSTQLNSQLRQYYQEILSSTYQDYMQNENNINNWDSNNCQNVIQQTINVMEGIAQTMIINQQPFQVNTDGAQLVVDKLDYITLMSKYFNDNTAQPNSDQLSQNYYAFIQTWPTTHPLYRSELSDINKQYYSQATQDQLAYLQKTYPVMVPTILASKNTRRRQLSFFDPNLPNNFQLQFPTEDEKLSCIQRSKTGKWVYDSCKTTVNSINQKRCVVCSCSNPSPTSLITDVQQLFDNQNVKDLFSQSGFERIFHLNNWQEYAVIWTIIALNIFFIIILIIGNKYDKIDNNQNIKKQFLFYNSKKGQTINKGKENIFMQIKNMKIKTTDSYNQADQDQVIGKELHNEANQLQSKEINVIQTIQRETGQQDDIQKKEITSSKSVDQIDLNSHNNQIYINKSQTKNIRIDNNPNIEQLDKSKKSFDFVQTEEYENGNQQKIYNQQDLIKEKEKDFICYEEQDFSIKSSTIKTFKVEGQFQIQEKPQPHNQPLITIFTQNENDQSIFNMKETEGQELQNEFNFQPTPQPANKVEHNYLLSSNQIQLYENTQNQSNNLQNGTQTDQQSQKQVEQENKNHIQQYNSEQDQVQTIIFIEESSSQHQANQQVQTQAQIINSSQQKSLQKTELEIDKDEIKKRNFLKAKQKLQMYLDKESKVNAILISLAFNYKFSFWSQAQCGLSDCLKHSIYYNYTNSYYTSDNLYILVAISDKQVYDANMQIVSYFSTLILQDYIYGIGISTVMYLLNKKYINVIQKPMYLNMIGSTLLLSAFQE
ncbi:hypothetical protein ABPG73_014447 [Tetrahymena malaccensis]